MKNSKIFVYAALALSAFGMQSCLDYDTPGDEFNANQTVVPPVISSGKADVIDYEKVISDEGVAEAIMALDDNIRTAQTGVYGIRGGKDGGAPVAHAYQFCYSLGPDNYVQYFCVPHYDFPYSNFTLRSTYDMCKGSIGGPGSGFSSAKLYIAPLLNTEKIDSVPELKAIFLTLFNYSAIENADLFGPMPYEEFKALRDKSPFKYNDVRTIYYGVKKNLDDAVACLKYYKDNRSEAYKQELANVMYSYLTIVNDPYSKTWEDMEPWIRFANSLKLRMAIHMSGIEPETAKTWAEEAVRDGVITDVDNEVAIYPVFSGKDHPLVEITGWSDAVMGASFLNLLENLDHPYMKYLFTKNSVGLAKSPQAVEGSSCPATTPANSVYVGMRDGVAPGEGQAAANNPYCGYSMLDKAYLAQTQAPLFLMKCSEVYFLLAEGALRGWNMGGTAKQFYEQGIRNASLESRSFTGNKYNELVDDYLNVEAPKGIAYVDPQGLTPDMPSVTKIGVKWNEGDSPEVKLEKIITQKYIASFPYSYESWVDLRRVGYPKLFPILGVADSDGTIKAGDSKVQTKENIMRRIPWASDDPQTKEDIANTGIPALGEGATDTQGQHLWWDNGASNF
ncbi:SusD/RagB family nutrient-binding outer membrane lipoprotein [Leyella stercorea]|uniref:SusD/RagB family nutrient-binding outer membrane lipoprotein n=2 Tax=Leyella stercorea TaxID=363265 RepID=UPI00242C4FDB|nr:SusD/RagB family nutrient-binding outer membrane lipoprotein [Leyella stercorea]